MKEKLKPNKSQFVDIFFWLYNLYFIFHAYKSQSYICCFFSEMMVFLYSLDRNLFNIYYNREALLLTRKWPSFTLGFDKLREMNPSISRILSQTSGREVNFRHGLR